MEIEFPVCQLLAIAGFMAGKKDERSYLRGVCIDIRGSSVTLVATNGHMMGVARANAAVSTPCTRDILVPSEVIAKMPKRPSGHVKLSLLGDDECKVQVGDMSLFFKNRIDKFVDWRAVMPSSITGELAHYNAEYLATIQKAFSTFYDFKDSRIVIGYNGDGPALVFPGIGWQDPDIFAIIMPLRVRHGAPKSPPSWVNVGCSGDTSIRRGGGSDGEGDGHAQA